MNYEICGLEKHQDSIGTIEDFQEAFYGELYGKMSDQDKLYEARRVLQKAKQGMLDRGTAEGILKTKGLFRVEGINELLDVYF